MHPDPDPFGGMRGETEGKLRRIPGPCRTALPRLFSFIFLSMMLLGTLRCSYCRGMGSPYYYGYRRSRLLGETARALRTYVRTYARTLLVVVF